MRMSLLDMTKAILQSMESDEVSSISETPESQSVARIVKECYFDLIGDLSPAESEGLYRLDASTDDLKPTLMLIPSRVSKIVWVKYDDGEADNELHDVRYVSNEEFFYYQSGLDDTLANVGSMNVSVNSKDFEFKFYNDRLPSYYTIFSDRYVVFDSFDISQETTLTESRSVIWAHLVPEWEDEDDFVPDLDPRQFSLLLNEARAQAFVEHKQIENPKAERKARKNKINAQQNKRDNDPRWANQQHVQFGRSGRNGYPRNSMQRAMRMGQ